MCEHCGCQSFPLVRQLTEEHQVIHDAIGALVRAVRAGAPEAGTLLGELIGLVDPHAAREERTLFQALDTDAEFSEALESLREEHDEIHDVLAGGLRNGIDPPVMLAALERLYAHIDKEEYGIFPAAVVLLDIAAWDQVTQPT